jgi:MFS family permease
MAFGARLRRIETFRAFRHRNYRYLWLGQTGQSATLWMDQVARAVLILELTDDSPVALSAVIAVRLAPTLFFGLIAGAVADRFNRKHLLIGTQTTTMLTHLAMGVLAVAGVIETWHVFAAAFVAGSAQAFNQPVRQSMIPLVVPREDLMNAVALNSSAVSFMRIGGGSAAGLLLIPFDVGEVYLCIVAIFVAVIASTFALDIPGESTRKRSGSGIMAEVREGFAYVGRNRDLGMVTALAVILFVFGFPYQQVFVPLLATDTLDLGDSGVGFLAGATGVGAFAGSLVVAARGSRRPGVQLMLNMIVFGSALIVISLQQTVVGTALLLALAGAMTVTYMAFTNSILLTNSDPEMHGRVMSLLSLDRGLIPLGAIGAGLLAEWIGVRPGLGTMGAIVLVASVVSLLVFGRRLAAITTDGEPMRPGHGHAGPVAAETERQAAGSR